jgi:hypothetical protein
MPVGEVDRLVDRLLNVLVHRDVPGKDVVR